MEGRDKEGLDAGRRGDAVCISLCTKVVVDEGGDAGVEIKAW